MSPVRPRNAHRAIGLLRVSTDADRQELGLEAQREAISRWAKANGVEVVTWRRDEASGAAALDDRPGLLEALGLLVELDCGLLVVAKRDRLARDVVAAAMIESLAQKAGARVVSAAGEGEGDDPTSQLMRRIVDAFAEYERAVIRARIKSALAVKRGRGELLGKAPFGWRAAGAKPRRLVPETGEQLVLARACALRDNGLTVRAVAEQLKLEGLVGRAGRALAHQQVAKLLSTGKLAPASAVTPSALLDQVLVAAASGIELAYVPDLARELGSDIRGLLLDLARAGKVELRPWSGGESMDAREAVLCPFQPAASSSQRPEPLAYVRLKR